MSELTELLADQNVPSAVYDALDPVRELLPKHETEVAAKAREEALKVACHVSCSRCDLEDAMFRHRGEWLHGQRGDVFTTTICEASDIRAEFARRWPEEFGPGATKCAN